jgi:precorrin-8X/cobalt-precorrin-8 methylmutase
MNQTQTRIALQPFSTPEAIEARSFEIIDAEIPEPRPFSGPAWEVVRRMVHTTADNEMPSLVRMHPKAIEAGVQALASGRPIFTDTEMARAGMPLRRLSPLGCRVECLLSAPEVARTANEQGMTRSAAAFSLGLARLKGAIVAIGNAPTALLALLQGLEAPDAPLPALIVGMPVGYVNAAESKALLMAQTRVPYIAIQGRKGGSALAASVINALAEIALRSRNVL